MNGCVWQPPRNEERPTHRIQMCVVCVADGASTDAAQESGAVVRHRRAERFMI